LPIIDLFIYLLNAFLFRAVSDWQESSLPSEATAV